MKTQFFVSPVIGLWLGISVFLFGSPAFANIPAIERAALIALYRSTDGDHWWYNYAWKTPPLAADGFSLPGTENHWYGITCDSTNTAVQKIVLEYNDLNGSLPTKIGNLPQLSELYLYGNNLSGSIPPELGNLTYLEGLDLGANHLSGRIPREFGNLTNLVVLNLSFNDIRGNIPTEIGNLPQLSELYLNGNNLSGSIPPELGHLINLEDLYLNRNYLSGSIPPELGNLTQLKELNLDFNDLTGSIPPELGHLINLEVLSLDKNYFSGSIPLELSHLTHLKALRLDENSLIGPIPPELGNLTHLECLSLSRNHLRGSIPPELGHLTGLWRLDLSENNLTGTIPPELGNLPRLGRLSLGRNYLTGSIPPELAKSAYLWFLDLGENDLTGSIPLELGSLTNLYYLYLSGNYLSGSIPTELGNLTRLTHLNLSSNNISGTIPTSLGNLTYLYSLNLQRNYLSGSIPPELGHLWFLHSLHLDKNCLSGSIPTELGYLTYLGELDLSSNCLSGDIPANLQYLYGYEEGFENWIRIQFNICWNALYTNNRDLRDYLNSQSPNAWEPNQTISPKRVSAAASSSHSIDIHWKPIRYKEDSGGYRVFYSTSARGPFTYFGMTADKFASAMTVTGLKPNSTYYFRMQTRTNPHANNRNTVDSVFSGIVSASTLPLLEISGHITYKGSGLAGVSLRLSNNGPTAFTDTNGFYRAMVDHGWSGTITPVKEHYQFIPVFRTYPAVFSGQTSQDFEAILSLMVTLRAERKTESAFIIRRDYGLLTLTVGNGNQVPGIRYVIERNISGGAYQMIKELTDPDLANGTFVYYDKFLDKDKSYTYRVLAYDPDGNILSLSSEATI